MTFESESEECNMEEMARNAPHWKEAGPVLEEINFNNVVLGKFSSNQLDMPCDDQFQFKETIEPEFIRPEASGRILVNKSTTHLTGLVEGFKRFSAALKIPPVPLASQFKEMPDDTISNATQSDDKEKWV